MRTASTRHEALTIALSANRDYSAHMRAGGSTATAMARAPPATPIRWSSTGCPLLFEHSGGTSGIASVQGHRLKSSGNLFLEVALSRSVLPGAFT